MKSPYIILSNARYGVRASSQVSRSFSSLSPLALQEPIRAAYYRGGTSRALIFQPKDLPRDRSKWKGLFRQLMGTPDPNGRQLNGMGAGISSLSKICLVERTEASSGSKESQPEGNCVDYTFVGLGIEKDEVDVAGNCGNMSSAIGPYAYNVGLLGSRYYTRTNGECTVNIRNTNTNKWLRSTFIVSGGQAAVNGTYEIDGVAGTGAKIKLEYIDPYGSKTGKVLPTGNTVDEIAGYRVTCVDGANPAVFVRADEVDIDGTILPNDFIKLSHKLEVLEKIRTEAAVAMGLAKTTSQVPRTIPKIGIVSLSSTHSVLSGVTVKSSQTDLVVRFVSDAQPHRAIPLTMALTTAIAARIKHTIVEQLLSPEPVANDAITIGHASGTIQVNATMHQDRDWKPSSATVFRTAKRIFDGDVYWTDTSDPSSKGEVATTSDHCAHLDGQGWAFIEECRGCDP